MQTCGGLWHHGSLALGSWRSSWFYILLFIQICSILYYYCIIIINVLFYIDVLSIVIIMCYHTTIMQFLMFMKLKKTHVLAFMLLYCVAFKKNLYSLLLIFILFSNMVQKLLLKSIPEKMLLCNNNTILVWLPPLEVMHHYFSLSYVDVRWWWYLMMVFDDLSFDFISVSSYLHSFCIIL